MAAARYEIVVRGRLGSALTTWFADLEVRSSGPDATYLYGWFADQSIATLTIGLPVAIALAAALVAYPGIRRVVP